MTLCLIWKLVLCQWRHLLGQFDIFDHASSLQGAHGCSCWTPRRLVPGGLWPSQQLCLFLLWCVCSPLITGPAGLCSVPVSEFEREMSSGWTGVLYCMIATFWLDRERTGLFRYRGVTLKRINHCPLKGRVGPCRTGVTYVFTVPLNPFVVADCEQQQVVVVGSWAPIRCQYCSFLIHYLFLLTHDCWTLSFWYSLSSAVTIIKNWLVSWWFDGFYFDSVFLPVAEGEWAQHAMMDC